MIYFLYLDNELSVLGFFDMVQHVFDVQRKLELRLCHVVDGWLLRQRLVPDPDTLRSTSKYVPHLVVETVGHPAPASFELALLQHVYPENRDIHVSSDRKGFYFKRNHLKYF